MKKTLTIKYLLWLMVPLFVISCEKDKTDGFLSPALKYTNPSVKVSVGATLIRTGAMVTDESTKPLQFTIEAIRYENGDIADKVMNYRVDTYFWNAEYSDKDKTAQETDGKRTKVNRPAIDINPENGDIIIYPEATDSFRLTKGKYLIDVKVKNSAGEQLLKSAMKLDISYALPYSFLSPGIDGKLTGIDGTFERLSETGNKILVYVLKKDGTPVDPEKLIGYDYSTDPAVEDLRDWHHLGLNNPTKYTAFPDHLELEVETFPIPYVQGKVRRIDLYNNGDINGDYFNFWFDFAIRKPGIWKITIQLKYN
ncbi:DUF5007 domain-containing protein [Chitinophaga sp. G-6-1-13]|uniref:DUF5007 domain-containing protein n=1 Tax=Chitinophaga fulva TaxID=2728842 RepID=A0A848GNB0_9BACT|nr:DUF5007 domain-containing protein [Chitinophaga fulva]NML38160.1 DUF5007 domain-containing protein [Chitinophaga fulva]